MRNKIFIIFYLFVSFAGARFKTRANSAKMGNAATRMTATKNVYGLLFEHKSIWQTRQRRRGSNPHSPYPLGQYSVCPLATVSSSLACMKLKERDTLYMSSTPLPPPPLSSPLFPLLACKRKNYHLKQKTKKKAAAANKTKDERQ